MEHKRTSKYERGKIYKICSDDPAITDVYVGSTIQPLYKRMSGHAEKFKNGVPQYSTFNMFDKYGIDKFHIELIECYPCESLKILFMREQHFIDTITCINMRKAYADSLERRKLFRPQKAEYDKNRRENNKEKIAAEKKEYGIINKEKISEKNAIKYLRNKEQLKIKIVCECGTVCCNYSMSLHIKTQKHINLMTALQQTQVFPL
jgi:hypothetical protein